MELRDAHFCHCCDSTYVQLSKSALVCLHIVKVCHTGVLTDGVFLLTGNQPFFFFLICMFHILPL